MRMTSCEGIKMQEYSIKRLFVSNIPAFLNHMIALCIFLDQDFPFGLKNPIAIEKPRLTSCTVDALWLKQVKGGSGSVWHRQVLTQPTRFRGLYPSHLPIKSSLEMSTLPP